MILNSKVLSIDLRGTSGSADTLVDIFLDVVKSDSGILSAGKRKKS